MAKIICTGSLMDGLAIDLVKYAGLGSLSEIQSDLLWSNNTDISIVQQCSFAELVVTGDFDSFPGRSTYSRTYLAPPPRTVRCRNIRIKNGSVQEQEVFPRLAQACRPSR